MTGRFLVILVLLGWWLPTTAAAQEERKIVVCSTTQIADFARQVVGDDWQVNCILGPGQDPHTYEPRIEDAELVSRSDLCLQNGWHLEGGDWMKKLAERQGKPIVTCVQGIQAIEIKEEDEEHLVHDPHAWFAPRNAAIYVKNILNAVTQIDPDGAERYEQRAAFYLGQLNALDLWIKSEIVKIPANRRILVTHHDAFGYFCDTYGFQAISPAGWTTEEFAGIQGDQRQNIVNQIRELGVRSIFVESTLDQTLLKEIAKDAGASIGGKLYSDAMGPAGSAGESYLGMMRENVLTIVAGLK